MDHYLRAWRKKRDLTQERLAELCGTTKGEISKLENGSRRMTTDWMATLAKALGLPRPHDLLSPPQVDGAPVPLLHADGLVGEEKDLPVYASAEGGPTGMMVAYEPIEWVKRPDPLFNVPKAFGFFVVGESMLPRYEPGELLLVHPTKPAHRNDYVLVILTDAIDSEHSALVKRFIGWKDGGLVLEQLNPQKTLDPIPKQQVRGIHIIVGTYGRR